MTVYCPNCERRLKLADESLADKAIRVRCGECKHVFLLNESEQKDVIISPRKNIASIPDLPTPIKDEPTEKIEEVSNIDDSETSELIDIFTGENNSSTITEPPEHEISSDVKPALNILKSIQTELTRNNDINVENHTYELLITNQSHGSLKCIRIRHDNQRREITVKSFLLLLKSSVFSILKILSQQECIGTFCIENYKNDECFAIKHTMGLDKYELPEVVSEIIRVYQCSIDIAEIIEEYSE